MKSRGHSATLLPSHTDIVKRRMEMENSLQAPNTVRVESAGETFGHWQSRSTELNVNQLFFSTYLFTYLNQR